MTTILSHNRESTAKLVKLIAFDVGKLSLALALEQVQKVINLPPIYSSGLNPIGVAQIGEREITVIDLHRRLFRSEAASTEVRHSYLLLLQTAKREILGISVTETPLLIEVPTTLIRRLPESYRRADTLEIASHIAVVPLGTGGSRTLFLLDVEMLGK